MEKGHDLGLELNNYAEDPRVKKVIYHLLLRKELQLLNPDKDDDYIRLRNSLIQYLDADPGGKNDQLVQS